MFIDFSEYTDCGELVDKILDDLKGDDEARSLVEVLKDPGLVHIYRGRFNAMVENQFYINTDSTPSGRPLDGVLNDLHVVADKWQMASRVTLKSVSGYLKSGLCLTDVLSLREVASLDPAVFKEGEHGSKYFFENHRGIYFKLFVSDENRRVELMNKLSRVSNHTEEIDEVLTMLAGINDEDYKNLLKLDMPDFSYFEEAVRDKYSNYSSEIIGDEVAEAEDLIKRFSPVKEDVIKKLYGGLPTLDELEGILQFVDVDEGCFWLLTKNADLNKLLFNNKYDIYIRSYLRTNFVDSSGFPTIDFSLIGKILDSGIPISRLVELDGLYPNGIRGRAVSTFDILTHEVPENIDFFAKLSDRNFSKVLLDNDLLNFIFHDLDAGQLNGWNKVVLNLLFPFYAEVDKSWFGIIQKIDDKICGMMDREAFIDAVKEPLEMFGVNDPIEVLRSSGVIKPSPEDIVQLLD